MLDLSTGELSPVVVTSSSLLVAWLLQRYIPLASSIDPIAVFRFICDRMGNKVLPKAQQTSQHYISGTLALVVLVLPILIVTYLVASIASYPFMFNILILYVCLQFSSQQKACVNIYTALQKQKPELAKALLTPHVLRDTDTLSVVGIAKASIEMFILRITYQQVVTIFCFVISGPVGSLGYRLCYEAQQSWNRKHEQFDRFGFFAHYLCSLIQFLPVRLFTLLLLLMSINTNSIKHLLNLFNRSLLFGSNGAFLLATASKVIHRNMSGAVKYQRIKRRRPKFMRKGEPTASNIPEMIGISTGAVLLYMVLIFAFSNIILI